MAGKEALQDWVLEALKLLGGSGTPTDVARKVWKEHERDLRDAGDLFFTWQYDIRWAAQKLRDAGKLRSVDGDRRSQWELNGEIRSISSPEGLEARIQPRRWPLPPSAAQVLGELHERATQDDATPDDVDSLANAAGSWLVEKSAEASLADVFPTLPPHLLLLATVQDVRMQNVLRRSGQPVFADISASKVADLLGLRGIGVLSVQRLLTDLVTASFSNRVATIEGPLQSTSGGGSEPWLEQAADDFATVASWRALVGRPNSALLQDESAPDEPIEVLAARERLSMLTAATVLGNDQKSAAELIDEVVSTLDPRSVEVLARRLFSDSPVTLDLIGESFGVTRERVRQIEVRARQHLEERLRVVGADGLFVAVRARILGVSRLETLLQELPGLRAEIDSLGQPVWRVLDRLDDAYEIEHGWCASPSLRASITDTQNLLAASKGGRLPTLTEVSSLLAGVDLPEERLPDWLAECGLTTFSGHVLVNGDGIRERARAMLQMAGEPLSANVIHEQLGVPRSLTAVKNALSAGSPDTFVRVDRGEVYALSEWGLSAYTSIRDLIRKELELAGGQVSLGVLIDHITTQFSVAANSVATYAASFPFDSHDGVVTLASARQLTNRSPWRTRRLYRVERAWHLRTEITQDHARGAGSVIPSTLAATLGIEHGDLRELSSRLGPQTVTARGLQPSLGSVRRFVENDGLEVGESVFFVFSDGGEFDVRRIPADGQGIAGAALALIGASYAAGSQPLATLAASVGASTHNGLAGVIDAFRARGDDDVAELLELM